MARKYFGKIIRGAVFVLIFCAAFLALQAVLQAKWQLSDIGGSNPTTTWWHEYDELEEDSLDVLLLGTSHVAYGMDAMYMYGETGITGYGLSGPFARMELLTMAAEDALKSQTPRLVLLDASTLHLTGQESEGNMRKILDQLPLTAAKVRYAFTNAYSDMDVLNVLFPLFRYHSRWDDLSSEDLEVAAGIYDDTAVRGHYITYTCVPTVMSFGEEAEDYAISEENLMYLTQMQEICGKAGTELVLYKIPNPDWTLGESEAVAEAARERGLTFLDLSYDISAIGIDPETDFQDETDHLNQPGAEKVSAYLAALLQERYDLPDHRGAWESWEEDYEAYLTYKEAKRSITASLWS